MGDTNFMGGGSGTPDMKKVYVPFDNGTIRKNFADNFSKVFGGAAPGAPGIESFRKNLEGFYGAPFSSVAQNMTDLNSFQRRPHGYTKLVPDTSGNEWAGLVNFLNPMERVVGGPMANKGGGKGGMFGGGGNNDTLGISLGVMGGLTGNPFLADPNMNPYLQNSASKKMNFGGMF